MDNLKKEAAKAALDQLKDDTLVLGIGTGSTVNFFIEELVRIKHRIEACIPSSVATETKLKTLGIPVVDFNMGLDIAHYIDGADEVTERREMIKGGGGALTREKILATAAKEFICIVDESKCVKRLGHFPLPIEVLPMARSFVARQLVKLGGDPEYRQGFVTDNGNIILDVYHLEIMTPIALEESIKLIPGVVENGLFAKRLADKVIVGSDRGVYYF